MQETSYTCDICRQKSTQDKMSEVRVQDKVHDLCEDCSTKLDKVLKGTGRAVAPQVSPFNNLVDLASYIPGNIANEKPLNSGGLISGTLIPGAVPPWVTTFSTSESIPTSGTNFKGILSNAANLQQKLVANGIYIDLADSELSKYEKNMLIASLFSTAETQT